MVNKIISIVIPHKNSIEKLKRLLSSIPVREDIEILVIDDGSNQDNCIDIIKNDFPNVSFMLNKTGRHNAGVARNIGLSKVSGDWILFADADDFFVPKAFDKIFSCIDSKYDCIYFSPTSINENTGEIDTRHIPYLSMVQCYINNSDQDKIRYKYYVPWSKLVKRELIVKNNLRFDEIPASNDVMFSLYVGILSKKIAVYDKVIYCVTRSENSLTETRNLINIRSRLDAAIRYNNFIMDNRLNVNLTMKPRKFYKRAKYKIWVKEDLKNIINYKLHKFKIMKNKITNKLKKDSV